MKALDEIDYAILKTLQHNGRISNAKLAEMVSLSPAATYKRLKRLEEQGVIEGYRAELSLDKLGYNMLCYISVGLQKHSAENLDNFRRVIREMPEVLEGSFITGDYDYLLKVALRDQTHLEEFILKKLSPIPGVAQMNTSLLVSSIKHRPSLLD